MHRTLLTLAAALLAVSAAPARAEPAGPELASGRIESDEGRVEILGRALRAGDTIRLPEGFLRVEEDGREDREIGSFTVVPARRAPPVREAAPDDAATPASAEAPPPEGPAAAGVPSAPGRATRDCRAERSAYIAELWRQSGIEVSSPADLVEALDGGDAGPDAGFYWFALQTDPFRPLAWNSELRARAEALARCARGG
jgi:hypothetical protein